MSKALHHAEQAIIAHFSNPALHAYQDALEAKRLAERHLSGVQTIDDRMRLCIEFGCYDATTQRVEALARQLVAKVRGEP